MMMRYNHFEKVMVQFGDTWRLQSSEEERRGR
jgi:hypothetical protein